MELIKLILFSCMVGAGTLWVVYIIICFLQGSKYEIKEPAANTLYKEIIKNNNPKSVERKSYKAEPIKTNAKAEDIGKSSYEEKKISNKEKEIINEIYLEPKESNNFIGWNIDLLQKCEWKVFEEICKNLLEEMGYNAKTTRVGADGGIDIIFANDRLKGVAQCKTGRKKVIGEKPIRELYGVMKLENSDTGIFFTSGTYTNKFINY